MSEDRSWDTDDSRPDIAAAAALIQEPTEDVRGQAQKVRVGQKVDSLYGQRGRVSRLLRDRESRQVTHLVVRTRRFLGHEVIVPVEWVAEVASDRVLLSGNAEGFDRLPVYRTDEEIDGDVEHALSRDQDLHRSGELLMTVSVRDGIVTLRGYVPDQRSRESAEEVTSRTRGVRGTRDRLVADDDLEVRVARALADDDRTRPYVIRVNSRQGIVHLTGTLEGRVASAETQIAAQETAANVVGVRSAVVQFPETRPVGASPILPGVGLPVYTTDGLLGQLELVVMDRRSRIVTDLVVVGHLPSGATDGAAGPAPETRCLLISTGTVSRVTEQAIFLHLDRATATRFPDYRGDHFRIPERGWHSSFDYRREDVRFAADERDTSGSSGRTWMGAPRG